jgi:hypothetical protein
MVTYGSMCGRIVVEVARETIAMSTPLSPAQIEQLRRNAKRLARTLSIPHSEALDRLAVQQGFRNWSLLSKHSPKTSQAGPEASEATKPPPLVSSVSTDPRRQYYLHGDQMEDDPSRYFCVQCDAFLDAQHFAIHGPHTGERFLQKLEQMRKQDKHSQLNWRRPEDAVNVLRESALAARAEYQALRPVFSDWLREQGRRMRTGERRDNIAVMAIGLVSRRGLPTRPQSLPLLIDHYSRRGHQHYKLKALEDAWDEFLAAQVERL